MELEKIGVGDILTILTLITSLYSFYVLKMSRFIVINKKKENVVKLGPDVDIKFKNIPLRSNLYHYRLLILFYGSSDVKKEEIHMPFTLVSKDTSCRWLDIKVINNTSNSKPTIKKDKNRLFISDTIVKKGDLIEIDCYIEAKYSEIKFQNRIFNVDQSTQLLGA